MTEKKTAEQILESLSFFEGYSDFTALVQSGNLATIKIVAIEASKILAKQACREQREICAESARTVGMYPVIINKSSILNAEEPEI